MLFFPYSSVSSVESFIGYFCLDKEPGVTSYQPTRRLSLCHVIHSLSQVLKRSRPLTDFPSLSGPEQHPSFNHVFPVVAYFCIPLVGSVQVHPYRVGSTTTLGLHVLFISSLSFAFPFLTGISYWHGGACTSFFLLYMPGKYYKGRYQAMYVVYRILYQLWSGQWQQHLSEHFKNLDQFHPFERDNVLGMENYMPCSDVTFRVMMHCCDIFRQNNAASL